MCDRCAKTISQIIPYYHGENASLGVIRHRSSSLYDVCQWECVCITCVCICVCMRSRTQYNMRPYKYVYVWVYARACVCVRGARAWWGDRGRQTLGYHTNTMDVNRPFFFFFFSIRSGGVGRIYLYDIIYSKRTYIYIGIRYNILLWRACEI